MMERLYCPGAIKGNKAVVTLTNGQCPKCFEKIDTQCCFQRHVKQCQGRTTCSSCHQLIIACQSENLEEKVRRHCCGICKCLSCFEDIGAAQKQSHCCKLAVRPFLRAYPSLACFDIETWTLPNGQLHDVMVHLAYESRVGGVFNEVTFTHTGLQFPLANMIRKHTYTIEYLPSTAPNVFDSNNLLRPTKKRKGNNNEQEEDAAPSHINVETWVQAQRSNDDEIMKDYQSYWKNLKHYSPPVSPGTRKRPMFKFLCFILSDCHVNR